MAWFDFLNQANPKGQDAGSIARQRLNARAGMPPRVPSAQPPVMRGGTGMGAGLTYGALLAPLAVGAGNYLRSPQGQLMKDRLSQGDIPGLFSAITGIGRSNAPQLKQYNPPGFDLNKSVSSADILQSAKEVGKKNTKEQITSPSLTPAPPALPQISPEERAYNEERSRIAQLTAQNPEFQNIGQLRNDLRDQGMAIWAAKYGPGSKNDLASKVKPGQSGYDIIQQTINPATAPMPPLSASSQAMLEAIAPVDATGARPNITPMPGQTLLYGAQAPQQVVMTPPPGVNAPQGLPGVQSIAPADAYTQGLEVNPEMRKKFQALLNQTQAQ